jgi:hypothetical protein
VGSTTDGRDGAGTVSCGFWIGDGAGAAAASPRRGQPRGEARSASVNRPSRLHHERRLASTRSRRPSSEISWSSRKLLSTRTPSCCPCGTRTCTRSRPARTCAWGGTPDQAGQRTGRSRAPSPARPSRATAATRMDRGKCSRMMCGLCAPVAPLDGAAPTSRAVGARDPARLPGERGGEVGCSGQNGRSDQRGCSGQDGCGDQNGCRDRRGWRPRRGRRGRRYLPPGIAVCRLASTGPPERSLAPALASIPLSRPNENRSEPLER